MFQFENKPSSEAKRKNKTKTFKNKTFSPWRRFVFKQKYWAICLNIYTCFFENRATKKFQSLALIGNLMALVTWKVKSHLKKKLLNTWASIW